MNILTSKQIVELEQRAVVGGTSLSTLMWRAGEAVSHAALELLGLRSVEETDRNNGLEIRNTQVQEEIHAGKPVHVVILCGKGNNGGDGFVCGELLSKQGLSVTVILALGPPVAAQAAEAFGKLGDGVTVLEAAQREPCQKALAAGDLIIDAIFGFHFSGTVHGDPEWLISYANRQSCRKLAIDIPSGVECDTATVSGTVFRAEYTVSFHAQKPANLSFPGREFSGKTIVKSLGVSSLLPKETGIIATDAPYVRKYLPKRKITGNKGDFGKLLLICGSYGMAGACILAARAALRSGIGLLYILLDYGIYPIVSTSVPEAVCIPVDMEFEHELAIQVKGALEKCTACVLGCGLGVNRDTLCEIVLSNCTVPLVIDADGLNVIASHPEYASRLSGQTVLTPHPGEFSRMIDTPIQKIQRKRLFYATQAAKELDSVLLLKGAGTVTVSPDGRTAINPTGNDGMAKGGSGDALSGMIGAFLAQGVSAYESAVMGAYLHGAAGDFAAEQFSRYAMLPSDLIAAIPTVFTRLLAGS